MKRIVAISLILAVCIVGFTGCSKINITTGLNRNEIYNISDEVFTLQEAKLFLGIQKYAYENSFGDEIWNQSIESMEFEEYVKLSVKNETVQLTCQYLFAKEKDISLTAAEEEQAKQIAQLYYDSLSEEQIKNTGIKLSAIQKETRKYALAQKVYEKVTEGLGTEISDVDAKVIKVQSICIASDSKEEALKVQKKAEAGEDFYQLAQEYSQDDTIEYNFCRQEAEKEFADAAFALSDGQISSIVETEKGYYIIKCISSYLVDESAAKKEELIQQKKTSAFKKEYDAFLKTLTFEFNKRAWNKISIESLTDIETSVSDVFESNYK